MFADVEEGSREFEKKRKRLSVSPGVQKIDDLRAKKESLIDGANIKTMLKKVGVTTQARAGELFPGRGRCTQDGGIVLEHFDAEGAAEPLCAVSSDDLKYFVEHRQKFEEMARLEDDAQNLKERYVQMALRQLEKSVDADVQVCPVCGTDIKHSVLAEIKKGIKELDDVRESALLDYSKEHPDAPVSYIENEVRKLSQVNASNDAVLSAVVAGGDGSAISRLADIANEYKEARVEQKNLEAMRASGYRSLKKAVPRIETLFKTAFQVNEPISCDDDALTVTITMPRDTKTYSSGEINLMHTIITLAQFQVSDKSLLIFDDPLSSLDKENQYATMFELVLSARSENKSVVVLTHNMDCISIARSQCECAFKYMAMERLDGKLYANELPKRLFVAPKISFIAGRAPASGSLNADLLLSYAKTLVDKDPENHRDLSNCLAYIDAAVRRETEDTDGADTENLNELVHFHSEYSDRTGRSNTDLVRAIDDFSESSLDMHDFVHRSIQKIYYLIALRVWVEKRIYEEFPDLRLKEIFEIGRLIQEVDGLWARGEGQSGRRGPSRQYLNSIKVMLNQNAHGLAQPAPFDYAVNLSSDRLCKKIDEVKEHLR